MDITKLTEAEIVALGPGKVAQLRELAKLGLELAEAVENYLLHPETANKFDHLALLSQARTLKAKIEEGKQ